MGDLRALPSWASRRVVEAAARGRGTDVDGQDQRIYGMGDIGFKTGRESHALILVSGAALWLWVLSKSAGGGDHHSGSGSSSMWMSSKDGVAKIIGSMTLRQSLLPTWKIPSAPIR